MTTSGHPYNEGQTKAQRTVRKKKRTSKHHATGFHFRIMQSFSFPHKNNKLATHSQLIYIKLRNAGLFFLSKLSFYHYIICLIPSKNFYYKAFIHVFHLIFYYSFVETENVDQKKGRRDR